MLLSIQNGTEIHTGTDTYRLNRENDTLTGTGFDNFGLPLEDSEGEF